MNAPTGSKATTDAEGRPLVSDRRQPSFKRDKLPGLLGGLAGVAIVAGLVWVTIQGQRAGLEVDDQVAAELRPLEQTAAFGMPDARTLVPPGAEATDSFSDDEVADALQRVMWANQQGRSSYTLGQTSLGDLLDVYAADQRPEIEAAMGTIDALDYMTVVDDGLATSVKAEAVSFTYTESEADGRPVLNAATTIFWAYAFEGDRSEDPMEHTVFLEHTAQWQVDPADLGAGVRLTGSEVNLANPDCEVAQGGIVSALEYEQWENGVISGGDCRN